MSRNSGPTAFQSVESAVDLDRPGRDRRDGRHALVAADAGHELIVEIVAVAALHRLDVAAELLVVLVDEGRCSRAGKTAGVPFVPAGHHDHRRIELAGPLPLFGKIGPAVQCRAGRIELAVVKTATAGVAVAHVRHPSVAGPQVLGHRNIDLLGLFRVVGVAIGLRVGGFPMPGVGSVDHLEWPMGLAEREKLLQLGAGLLGIANQERLALPAEPQIRVVTGLVEVVVNLLCRLAGLGIDHEGDLRRAAALFANGGKDLAELHIDIAISHGIRRIEDQRIDARVGEHLGMAADDPGVVAAVVAQQRLAPVVRKPVRSPERRVGLLQCVGIGGEDPGDIVRPLLAAPAFMPEEIEYRHEAVRPRRANFGSHRQSPAQGIGRRPRHARIAGQDRSGLQKSCNQGNSE